MIIRHLMYEKNNIKVWCLCVELVFLQIYMKSREYRLLIIKASWLPPLVLWKTTQTR